MSASPPLTSGRTRRRRMLVVHYLQMLVAMAVGMLALGPVEGLLFRGLGWSAALDRTEPMALLMATNMTIGMSAWMRYRRHSARGITEMALEMYVPFVVLFLPLWAGVISPGTLLLWGHLLMLPAMVVPMALRPAEYVHQ